MYQRYTSTVAAAIYANISLVCRRLFTIADSLARDCSAACSSATWEKQVLSARGFKRVGRRSEYAI
jgi:hypothetical protein